MKKNRLSLLLAIGLLCGAASAQTVDNWRSASGIDVKNANGDCWRNANWTPATAAPGCDGALAAEGQKVTAKEAAAPAAAEVKAPYAAETVIHTVSAVVNFDFAKSTLTPAAKKILDETVKKINLHGHVILEVNLVGHTDEIGTLDYNDKLSVRRAQAVKAYMISKGIPARLVDARGAGETQPQSFNATAAGRSANRRVEIKIDMSPN